jgi:hypothetical protein
VLPRAFGRFLLHHEKTRGKQRCGKGAAQPAKVKGAQIEAGVEVAGQKKIEAKRAVEVKARVAG